MIALTINLVGTDMRETFIAENYVKLMDEYVRPMCNEASLFNEIANEFATDDRFMIVVDGSLELYELKDVDMLTSADRHAIYEREKREREFARFCYATQE